MTFFKSLIFIFFIILTTHSYAFNTGGIDIEADTFEVDENTGIITAIGNVTVKKDDMFLWTNRIMYNKKIVL